jgi:type IV fimbrial biogenesis protein FimT
MGVNFAAFDRAVPKETRGNMNSEREQERIRRSQGFTLLELVFTLAIAMVMVVLAIPLVQRVSASLKIQGATAAVTGAMQSTRYQAIFQGCQYQLVFTSAAGSYQLQGEPATNGNCAAAFTNICSAGLANCPVPWSGAGTAVALGADATLTFTPGGRVIGTNGAACPCTMVLTYSNRTATITVSNYGNINVAYTP